MLVMRNEIMLLNWGKFYAWFYVWQWFPNCMINLRPCPIPLTTSQPRPMPIVAVYSPTLIRSI